MKGGGEGQRGSGEDRTKDIEGRKVKKKEKARNSEKGLDRLHQNNE